MEKQTHFNFWYFVAAMFLILLLQQCWLDARQVETIPYSEFQQLLRDGRVAEIGIAEEYIRGTLTEPTTEGQRFIYTVRVEPSLAEDLDQFGIEYHGIKDDNFLSNVLSWLLPIIVFFAIWMFVFRRVIDRQGMGGLMSIGKSKAKVYMETDTKVTFDDVAGVDEAKDELKEVVAFLREPQSYGRLGARIPKGVLLVGPPGTGKTLLARAVAGEAGVPFFSISGSEFVEMFVASAPLASATCSNRRSARRRASSSSTSWMRWAAPAASRRSAAAWTRRSKR